MLPLVFTRKKAESCEELNQNTAETPHVDLLCVGEHTQHDIRRSVESRLDVSIHNLFFNASRPKVSDDDPTLVLLLHQNVFGLKIAMDYAQLFEVAKRRQKLDGKPSDQPVVEALIVVHLDKFV